MPYSCQLQFGRSGTMGWPCGGEITMRAIGRSRFHSSSAKTGHSTKRAPPGSLRGGRAWIGEYSNRSCGCMASPGSAFVAKLEQIHGVGPADLHPIVLADRGRVE